METINGLRSKIKTTKSLEGIVGSMRALSSVSIQQYERASKALAAYEDHLKHALKIVLWDRQIPPMPDAKDEPLFILIGSNQGLVGHFNQAVWEGFEKFRAERRIENPRVLTVGRTLLLKKPAKINYESIASFELSSSVKGIAKLTEVISQALRPHISITTPLYIFYNRRAHQGLFETTSHRTLPLSNYFTESIINMDWPTKQIPMTYGDKSALFTHVVLGLVFVNLYKILAESQSAEHFMRVVAMQAAEKNIEEHLTEMNLTYQLLRQQQITDELLDVINGSGL